MSKELKSITFPGLSDMYEIPTGSGIFPILKSNALSDGTVPTVSFTSLITGNTQTLSPYSMTSGYWYKLPDYGEFEVSWPGSSVSPIEGSVRDSVGVIEAIGAESFEETPWSTIVSKCKSNSVPDGWAVGDSKAVGSYTVTIIGKNHDSDSSGNKCPLTLQVTTGPETDTNCARVSSFTSSDFYGEASYRAPDLIEGLRSVTGKAWDGTTAMKGWYPSVTELLGSSYVLTNLKYSYSSTSSGSGSSYSESVNESKCSDTTESTTNSVISEYAGSQYAYYAAGNSIKSDLWTRSTGYVYTSNTWYMGGNGGNMDQKLYVKTDKKHYPYNYNATGVMSSANSADTSLLAGWVFCL